MGVCSGSDELKNLKKLLNAAYLNLDLEKQISSKKLNQINAQYDGEKLLKEIEELNLKHDQKQKQVEEEKKMKLLESKEIIEKQKEMDFMQDLINELSMEENQLKILEKERKEFEK